jgi:hypothetical protein
MTEKEVRVASLEGKESMKMGRLAGTIIVAAVLNLGVVGIPSAIHAQQSQMRDDMAQLVVDLKTGMDRSTLTPMQKDQLKDDFRELRRAHQNHEMFATMRAARSIRTVLDSGAFKPEDAERIKQDMHAIKEARETGFRRFGS